MKELLDITTRWMVIMAILVPLASQAEAPIALVNHSDAWRYHKGTIEPQADWITATDSMLDASWLTGNGGLGYADNTAELAEVRTTLADMKGLYTTVFFRRSFELTNATDSTLHLMLNVDWDDGFIAWLDGAYLTSANSLGAPAQPSHSALATGDHESSRGNNSPNDAVLYDLGEVGSRLAAGPHVLSIVGLNVSSGSSDFIQIADLYLEAITNAPPSSNSLSGVITVNTTLYTTKSPYTFTGSVTVNDGVTLTIEPGTTIYMASGIDITIATGGQVLAEGTDLAPIQFTRAPGNPSAWGGITINGNLNSPETRLAYCHIEGNGKTCIEVAGGTLYLDHATFGTTTHQYVSLDNSSFLISHCHFPSTTASFELLHGTGGIKSGGRGIVRDSFFGTTHNYNDIMDFTGGNRPGQPIIQYYHNVFVGASDDILDLDGTDAWIEGNIFLHSHKNGTTPDSSAAVSGGSNSGRTSEITIIGNLFFDCDNAATAKQGNFYTLINNTIVHTTKTGGIDSASGVVTVRDLDPTPTTFGQGFYLEGNIIADAEQLVRNYIAGQTTVTFNNNILASAWDGPGTGNLITNPMLKHIPEVSETYFTNWADAQIMRDWFSLLPESPAIGTGPNGQDQGGDIPLGASISGEPIGPTRQTEATLNVGANRQGSGIPVSGWPEGSGFTYYQWRLDSGSWSAETSIATPIYLTNLANGPHFVEVIGKNDAGLYQNDPVLGSDAVVTRSHSWTVQTGMADSDGDGMPDDWEIAHGLNPNVNDAGDDPDHDGMSNLQEYLAGTDPHDDSSFLKLEAVHVPGVGLLFSFTAVSNKIYTLGYRDSLIGPAWSNLVSFPAAPTNRVIEWNDSTFNNLNERFYRLEKRPDRAGRRSLTRHGWFSSLHGCRVPSASPATIPATSQSSARWRLRTPCSGRHDNPNRARP